MTSKTVIALFVVLVSMCLSICSAEWEITKLDYQTVTGKYTAIALDSNDFPHIAYQDDNGPRLKYASYNGTGWFFENPSTETDLGYDIDMVLDSSDLARIVHYDDNLMEGVITVRNTGGTWDTYTIVESIYHGRRSCVALGEDGRTAVSYSCGSENKVIAAINWDMPGAWSHYNAGTGDIGCTAIQTKNLNLYPLHVAFSDYITRTMKCSKSGAPQWTTTTIDTDLSASSCAMQLDDDDYEHIVFVDAETGRLRYARNSSTGWTVETLFTDAAPSLRSLSYVRTPDGWDHICFQDLTNHLVYATNDGGTWARETVDQDGKVGNYCSLAIDSAGLAHISYQDYDLKDLKYARQLPPPTPTPTRTPTPTPSTVAYDLVMEDTYYTAGETFLLERTWTNTLAASQLVDEYILLDIQQMYWFWPTWSQTMDFSQWSVPVGGPVTDSILTFEWPAVGGEFTGIRFWGAFLQGGSTTLLDYDMVEGGYGETPPSLTLTSDAFANGQPIPEKYTCDGTDVSPVLAWNQPTQSIKSYALIVDDPDAPGGTWTHWVIYHIPANARECVEGIPTDLTLPDGSHQGKNSWNTIGYRGPCPPSGGAHRYFFTLYALDVMPTLAAGATKAELITAMTGHILTQTDLMGTYQK